MRQVYETIENDQRRAKPKGCRCSHLDKFDVCHLDCILLVDMSELRVSNMPNDRLSDKQMEID